MSSLILPSRFRDMRVMAVNDDAPTPEREAELALAKWMQEILAGYYPGYNWLAAANLKETLVWIAIPALMGETLRYVEHFEKVSEDKEMRKWLRKAGGEILERYRLPRTGYHHASMEAAKLKAVRNIRQQMPE